VATTILVSCLALLLVILFQAFPGDRSGMCDTCTVTFHNKTEEPLCTFYPCDEGGSQIKPRGKSVWGLDSCGEEAEVTVYTQSGEEIYNRVAGCYEWDDGFILINHRDGEFVVADNLNPPTPPIYDPGE
jgi:hypothetical protein